MGHFNLEDCWLPIKANTPEVWLAYVPSLSNITPTCCDCVRKGKNVVFLVTFFFPLFKRKEEKYCVVVGLLN